MVKTLTCQSCGVETPRRGPVQKYCEACSERRDLQRKRLWARHHPTKPTVEFKRREALLTRRTENGVRLSRSNRGSIKGPTPDAVGLCWLCRVSVPFSYAASKNAIWSSVPKGHVELGALARQWKDVLIEQIRRTLGDRKVVHDKLWIDIYVEKPDHKGDAVNVIDTVCDALKVATGLDDRWYSIRRVDWGIVKENPRLFVGFGQETEDDAQVCASCGRILVLDAFHKNANAKSGAARNCRECDCLNPRLRRILRTAHWPRTP